MEGLGEREILAKLKIEKKGTIYTGNITKGREKEKIYIYIYINLADEIKFSTFLLPDSSYKIQNETMSDTWKGVKKEKFGPSGVVRLLVLPSLKKREGSICIH